MLQPAVMVLGKKVILSKLTLALGGVGQFSVARYSFDLLFFNKTNTYYLKKTSLHPRFLSATKKSLVIIQEI